MFHKLTMLTMLLAIIFIGVLTQRHESEVNAAGNRGTIPADTMKYVVFAWNDLGMHCLNPTYDKAVLLPPYNTVWAQVVRRGNPPQIVTSGLTAEYRMLDNTYTYGKTDAFGGNYAQFWNYAARLFGLELAHDTGLNLDDPTIHNGLVGPMLAKGEHFQVSGIPVSPVKDSKEWTPYQVIEITIKNQGQIVAQTRATVPTSDEINCAKCHGDQPFQDLMETHDYMHGTTLTADKPVLCASCHGSPALGMTTPGKAGIFLSAAIHGAHAPRGAICIDCHPGATTKCNRSLAHTADDGNCKTCHGDMEEVAQTIKNGARTPWINEPKCATCHTGVAEMDAGTTLYRNATGHGGMYCASCHHSPHAMYPSRENADKYQPLQYQNTDLAIASCRVCHKTSKGGGFDEFGEEHSGSNGRVSACRVCHTAVPATLAQFPHSFQWKFR
jgi:hypothetical protein